jgi:uncharacterized membrane protein
MRSITRTSRLTIAALGLVLLAGTGLRFYRLDIPTITHVETYIPGIELPRDLVEYPLPRYTLWETVSGCIKIEPRPPLYYVWMLGWTKLFGTTVFSLRLPGALFGIASIPLVFLLGKRVSGTAAGLVAAGMLALNGHHVFWSQFARSYVPLGFLGLLSTLLLLRMTKGDVRPFAWLVVYAFTTLAGLGMEVFYWPIFVTQVAWVAINSRTRQGAPNLLLWQLFIWIAASPLLTLAAYQSRLRSHTLGSTLPFLAEFLQFGFLFERYPTTPLGPVATALAFVVLPLLALLLLGARLAANSEPEPHAELPGAPPVWLTACTALAVLALILAASAVAYLRSWTPAARMAATALVPVALFLFDYLLRRTRPALEAVAAPQSRKLLPAGLLSLSGLLAVVPITTILVISQVVPLFASRTSLPFTPFLLVAASAGLVALVRRDRRWLAVGVIVALAHLASLDYFFARPKSPRDYLALSQEVAPHIRQSDTIFVQGKIWLTTPIFYYLKPGRYRFVGEDYEGAIAKSSAERIWAIVWGNEDMWQPMADALREYDPGAEIKVEGARAVLYTPRAGKRQGATASEQERPARGSIAPAPMALLTTSED